MPMHNYILMETGDHQIGAQSEQAVLAEDRTEAAQRVLEARLARSISMTPWAPGATACETSARCRLMACVSHRGSTKAAPLPLGQIAPKM